MKRYVYFLPLLALSASLLTSFSSSLQTIEKNPLFTYQDTYTSNDACNVLFPAIEDSDLSSLYLIKEDEKGNKTYTGYYGDLFNSISQVSSLNINYIVPRDEQEFVNMSMDFLLHGKDNEYGIDVCSNLTVATYNNRLSYPLTFFNTIDLKTPVYLYSKIEEKTISEFDYETYKGKTVGITYVYNSTTSSYVPTVRDNYFFSWASSNGLYDDTDPDNSLMKVKKYYSFADRNEAFDKGEIDIIVERYSLPIENVRTLATLGYILSYSACVNDRLDIFQKIDSGIAKLNADYSNYLNHLGAIWFPTNYQYVIFNEEEKQLINQKKILGGFTMGYPASTYPYIMKNGNELSGMVVDYIDYCEKYIGTSINFVERYNAEEAIQELSEGKLDYWFGRNANHAPDEFIDTEPYFQIDERFVVNRNKILSFAQAQSIGCYSFDGVGTEYEDRLTFYKDPIQMLDDLNEGRIDGIITSTSYYHYARYTLRYDNLFNQSSLGTTNLVFFSSQSNVIAHSIMNKCIFSLTNEGIDAKIVEDYELAIDFRYNTGDFFLQNATILIISAVILLISAFCIAILFIIRNKQSRKNNQELIRLNSTDYMTGLLNKRMFNERTARYIKDETPFSIMMIDLNDFKSINDTYSHLVGDEVITEIGRRLKTLKENNNWVYRFGGDEFVVFSNFIEKEEIETLAKRIMKVCEDNIIVNNNTSIHVTLSIGIASFPKDATSIDELLVKSDSALYDLKAERAIGYEFFDNEKNYPNVKMNKVKMELDKAIEEKRIYMVFQPIIDSKSKKSLPLKL